MPTRPSNPLRMISFSLLGCVFLASASVGAQTLATLTVEAGPHDRVDTLVSASLEAVDGLGDASSLRLQQVKGTERVAVPMQIEAGPTPVLWWVLSGTMPAGSSRVYELSRGKPADSDTVTATMGETSLDLAVDGHNVLRYNHATEELPASIPGIRPADRHLYDRSAFIYPIWSPKGNIVTEVHPADHRHHMGIWMPWTHTRYEGQLVDFWNIQDGTGTVRFSKYLGTTDGPIFGGFKAEQDHVALKTSSGEKVILKEVWDIRVYNVGGPDKGYWLWDFKSTQRNVTDEPLIQEQYRYGGFAYRGAKEWQGDQSGYLTSEGKTRADGNGTPARWCDMYGSIDGVWEGVTVMSSPKNFRHPESIRIIPDADYVYFVYCPSVTGEWEMKPGEDHVFRYRLYMHEGKPSVADDERVWTDFAQPPQVTVEVSQS